MTIDKRYFLVTSHGWSASNWLAYVLQLHPKISCTHSARNVIACDKDLQSDTNLKRHLGRLHTGYFSRQNQALDSSYDEIEALGNTRYLGSVHRFRLRDIPVVFERFGPFQREYRVMNLVRHPVTLVWSGYGQFQNLFRYDINELHWTLGKVLGHAREFAFDLGRRYDLMLGDYEVLAFLAAAVVLGSLRLDLDAMEAVCELPNIDYRGHVQMEKVTRDPAILKEVICKLCGPELSVTPGYLQNAFNAGQINRHRRDNHQLSPEERWSTFNNWQRETFLHFMDYFNIGEPHEAMGYDLSFVRESSTGGYD